MSTPLEKYRAMLNELDDETKISLIQHILGDFARFYEEECPVDFRCGASDFQATCDECHGEFWADDYEAEAICPECVEEGKEEE